MKLTLFLASKLPMFHLPPHDIRLTMENQPPPKQEWESLLFPYSLPASTVVKKRYTILHLHTLKYCVKSLVFLSPFIRLLVCGLIFVTVKVAAVVVVSLLPCLLGRESVLVIWMEMNGHRRMNGEYYGTLLWNKLSQLNAVVISPCRIVLLVEKKFFDLKKAYIWSTILLWTLFMLFRHFNSIPHGNLIWSYQINLYGNYFFRFCMPSVLDFLSLPFARLFVTASLLHYLMGQCTFFCTFEFFYRLTLHFNPFSNISPPSFYFPYQNQHPITLSLYWVCDDDDH